MKFGKLGDVSRVDFGLPPDPERTLRVLRQAARLPSTPPQVYLGTTGWANPEWTGAWYPSKAKAGDYLAYYCLLFNCIELNTTHYRIPDPATVLRWREQAQAGFSFCPKVPQQISHRAKLRAEEPTLRFAEVVMELEDLLGPCFIQLPDHHGPKDLSLIHEFLTTWPGEVGLHWELRHPDWFTADAGPMGEVLDALEAKGHGTVITDVAGRRDVLHLQLTTPTLMLRFVGNGLHPTDFSRADAWIARICEWFQGGLQSAYLFLHQPDIHLVPEFAAYWAQALNSKLGLRLTVPRAAPTSVQGSLF